jgi:hypothetical protein
VSPADSERTCVRVSTLLSRSWLALALLCALSCADEPVSLAPVAVCGRAAAPPTIDGNLNEPAWRNATMLAPFVLVATHGLPTQATTCRVMRDATRIYIGFDCSEAKMPSLSMATTERDDARAWMDDCVHVFLAPLDPRHTYYHFVVTANNTVFDERALEDGQERQPWWNADVVTATRRGTDHWTCEISILLEDLYEGQPPQDSWWFSASRAEHPHAEWSSWSLLNAGFHEFTNFGHLLWTDEPTVTSLELPAPFVGRNDYRISLGQASRSYVTELQVIRDFQVFPKLPLRLTGGASASYGYDLQEEGDAAVRLVVRREDSHDLLYASPPVSFSVPRVRGPVAEMGARLASASFTVSAAPDSPLRRQVIGEVSRLREETRAIGAAADRLSRSARVPRDRWEELHRRAMTLAPQARVAELRGLLVSRGAGTMPSFGLGVANSLQKLSPQDVDYSLSDELQLHSCRQERESGQIVVVSIGKPVKGAKVQWTGLRGPGDARIDHDAIEVHRVGWVSTRQPLYQVERVGRWPDPLLPPEPFDVPAQEIQPLWVTVSVPPDATPGQYTGTLTVTAEGDAPQTIKLSLEVWDIQLPLHGKFRTGFGTVIRGDVSQWYGLRGDPPEDFRHKFYSVLLRNRINPASLYIQEVWPLWSDFDWCYERGLNALSLGSLQVADTRRLMDMARIADGLKQRNLLDMAYVYGYGDLSEEEVGLAREGFSKVRRALPGLRRASPVAPNKALWNYVNLWGTLTSEFDPVSAARRQRLGEDIWWYVCCGPRHPYANFFIDYPATDARTLFWAAYKYGISGFFYYEVAMWASNMLTQDIGDPSIVIHEDPAALEAIKDGHRWPDVPWNSYTFSRYNGDGLLIYPGPNETPLPSLRLEVIRDGIEDYELLALLEGLARKLKTLEPQGPHSYLVDEAMRLTSVNPQVVRDLTHFTSDPNVIAGERERVANQVLRLQRVVSQLEEERAQQP